jgi:coenzyme F420 hydrogenase subunit beta
MSPEKLQWKHLFFEVVTGGLCTGCAGCVVACPHDVLGPQPEAGRPERRALGHQSAGSAN